VDEGKGFESMQEGLTWRAPELSAPFKKKNILVVIRELSGEELENLWPFELK
jgi:hypothetical protein